MAEPGPAADKTAGLNNDETVAVPNSAAPDAAELAWSSNDDSDESDGDDLRDDDGQRGRAGDRQSWRATWRIAAALVAAGLVLAGAIVFGRSLLTGDTKAAPKPAAPATPKGGATPGSTAGSPPSAGPSSIVSTPDQDNKYIQALNDRGISFANPDAAIANGKLVCSDIGRGVSVPQITAAFRASNPGLADSANTYVTISVQTYCPQNNNLVGGGA
ncbi:DUF732 domain-containing protein [Mycobacterium sp. IS-836]|uniref:DUF732 domain-containing protein n=1 Tax=Mycobacterium sp. IS-836 TaxID=1834160 RepID=UPI001E459F36|nr:DUF732 domain-containing protein [Mycobacterium sp. IS-836]